MVDAVVGRIFENVITDFGDSAELQQDYWSCVPAFHWMRWDNTQHTLALGHSENNSYWHLLDGFPV